MRIFYKGIEGVELKLGGKTYVVPPLNFRSLIALTPEFETLRGLTAGSLPTEKQLRSIAKVIHAALRRNYPFIRFSTVFNGMDMFNMTKNLSMIMGNSGAKTKGEAPADSQ